VHGFRDKRDYIADFKLATPDDPDQFKHGGFKHGGARGSQRQTAQVRSELGAVTTVGGAWGGPPDALALQSGPRRDRLGTVTVAVDPKRTTIRGGNREERRRLNRRRWRVSLYGGRLLETIAC
jgi:hypothetical protein